MEYDWKTNGRLMEYDWNIDERLMEDWLTHVDTLFNQTTVDVSG